jgi:hypothetical protein
MSNMEMLREIKAKVGAGQYEYSKHAVDQSIIRRISDDEVVQAIATSDEIIEDYPDDKYGPSCLLLGFTRNGRPLHIQVSHPGRPIIKIVTAYEPDKHLWIDYKIRRSKQEG